MDSSFLSLPFFQRALFGGIIISFLLAFFGVITVLRKSSFFGDAVSHASLTGVAIGILLGVPPILSAILYGAVISFLIPYFQTKSRLNIDSILGIILPVSMALGVIILSFSPGYQPELISFLFGSVLSIGNAELIYILVATIFALILLSFILRSVINISFDTEYSKLIGINVKLIDGIYHLLLGVAVVLGISVVGVVLVNALLIIPATTAKLYSKSLKNFFILTPLISSFQTVFGLLLSIIINIPAGPSIAVVGGVMLGISVIITRWTK